MKTKSSAHYQREYRKRLREQGLVKREVWIRPEHGSLLSTIEKQLREVGEAFKATSNLKTGVSIMTDNLKIWTTENLFESLKEAELFANNSASIEVVEGVEPTIYITMHDYGDLPVFLTVSGEQIIVESVLWPLSAVNNIVEFNDAVLRTHKYFPLSTISLNNMGAEGQDYYYMFGALSSTSIVSNVVFEIETLASNVIQATSAYNSYLKQAVEA